MIKKIKKYILSREYRRYIILKINIFNRLSDKNYLKQLYKYRLGKQLNLHNPSTFNEKLQWLKLYDRNPEYTKLVDKYEVKRIITDIIGKEYIIPTLGVWNKFEEIDFDALPNQFALKCTHDSGGLVICKDKKDFDINKAKEKINNSLNKNYYWCGREWPYKNVKPRIIAEKYIEDESGELVDYKVHNFNGEPKIILVCKNRFKESGLTEDFFDTDWNHLNIHRPDHPNSTEIIKKPKELEDILELSKKLSEDIPFVRTDFYIINSKVYFGEMTFYPASGFGKFIPEEWDYKFGEWLTLPEKKK